VVGQRTPAYYRGHIAADGTGAVVAVYPDNSVDTLPIPDGYVIDGFGWGADTAESSRATAAAVILHLADRTGLASTSEEDVGHVTRAFVAHLDDGRRWAVSSLDIYRLLVPFCGGCGWCRGISR
jgi:hypothetical protein